MSVVARQLTFGFGTVIGATVVTGLIASLALRATVAEKDEIARDYAEDLARVENLRYRAEQVLTRDDVDAANQAFESSLNLVTAVSPREARDLSRVEDAWQGYLKAAREHQGLAAARAQLESRLDALVGDEQFDWAAAFERSRGSALTATMVVAFTTLFGVVASVWLALVLRRRLVRAVAAREEVLAVVSHDLRNPLSAILMRSRVAARKSAPEAASAFDKIREAAERMNALIEELLDTARAESGTLQLRVESCDLTALVDGTLELFEGPAAEQGVRLMRVLPERLDANVDVRRLGRVLTNLVGNALKFTPAGGEVTVRGTSEPGAVRLEVRDTGPGMTPEQSAHLFEKHWQARRAAGGGLGLGLYIVKRLVEAHGGTIDVSTAPGAGATFSVRLPQGALVNRTSEMHASSNDLPL